MSDQGVALANEVLYQIADLSPAHEATVLRIIANSAVLQADYESCEAMTEPDPPHSHLRVVN